MSHTLQDIVDQIVVVQQTIATPTNEKAITKFYDERPASITTFPCFVNVPEGFSGAEWNTGGRKLPYSIWMHLCFTKADLKYSDRSMRAWVANVLDKFHDATGDPSHNPLSAATGVVESWIADATLDTPFELGEGQAYIAASFRLEVIVEDVPA